MTPPFKIGAHVKILPLDDISGRVIALFEAVDGWTVDVRYFHNGESRIAKLFPDEVEL